MAVELQGIEERHGAQIQQAEARFSEAQEQFRQRLAAESKTPALEQSVAKLQADMAATARRRARVGCLAAGRRLLSHGRPECGLCGDTWRQDAPDEHGSK